MNSAQPMDRPAPAQPLRTWRPMVLWTAGLLLVLGIVWFVAAVAVPFLQTRAVLRPPGARTPGPVDRLGGPARAAERVVAYLRWPDWAAPDKDVAVYVLRCCGQAGAPALLRAAKDPNPEVRRRAIMALEGFCPTGEDIDPGQKRTGVELQDALPALIRALADRDTGVRQAAIRALYAIGSEAGEAILAVEKALNDEDATVRAAAAATLRKIQDEKSGKR